MNNEPVAWMYERPNGSAKLTFVREPMARAVVTETPLYTHPAKTLTDEEIADFEWAIKNVFNFSQSEKVVGLDNVIKAILRKANEK